MDRLLPYLRIKSGRHVQIWTAIVTLILFAAPVIALAIPIMGMPRLSARAFWMTITIAAVIPLRIAPPTAQAKRSGSQ